MRPLQAEQQGDFGYVGIDHSNLAGRQRPTEIVINHDHPATRNRSRFAAPASTTTISTPTFSSTITNIGDVTSERYINRGRLVNSPVRFNNNRGQNVSVRVHKKPLNDATPTDELPSQPRRINITHNGSSNNNKLTSESIEDAENHRFGDDLVAGGKARNGGLNGGSQINKNIVENASINPIDSSSYENVKEEKIQVARKQPQINAVPANENNTGDDDDDDVDDIDDEEDIIEDDEDDLDNNNDNDEPVGPTLQVTNGEKDNSAPGTTRLADGTVILTSNFFLPGTEGDAGDQEDSDESIDESADVPSSTTSSSTTTTTPATTTTAKATVKTTITQKPIVDDDSLVEYEYEYEDYVDETTTAPNNQPTSPPTQTTKLMPVTSTTTQQTNNENKTRTDDVEDSEEVDSDDPKHHEIVSVVTTKSVVNGSLPSASSGNKTSEDVDDGSANTTESWVVVASVQTSRSISGARFLPFPSSQVEQEEKKQNLSDLDKEDDDYVANDKESSDNDEAAREDDAQLVSSSKPPTAATIESTTVPTVSVTSTENTTHNVANIRINHEPKSSDLKKIHEKLLQENVEVTTKGVPVFIRKFSPKTTTVRTAAVTTSTTAPRIDFDSVTQDDLAGLLPVGFFRPTGGYKNRKSTTTTTTTTVRPEAETESQEVRVRNETDSRSYKNKVAAQDVALAGLLPADYKLNLADKTKDKNENGSIKVSDILSRIKFDDNLEKLLPKDYVAPKETTKAPLSVSTVTDDINKFLPPGYKQRKEEPKRPAVVNDDVSKLLPPGYKAPKDGNDDAVTSTSARPRLPTFTIADDLNKFLPPGYKPPADDKPKTPAITLTDNISKFLPPGYKAPANGDQDDKQSNNSDAEQILNKISFKSDISSLLPPGFEMSDGDSAISTTTAKATEENGSPGYKVVFPKSIKKPPRVTTPRPHSAGGPPPPNIIIRKGPPTR